MDLFGPVCALNIPLLATGFFFFFFAASGLHSVAVLKVKCVIFYFDEEETVTLSEYLLDCLCK